MPDEAMVASLTREYVTDVYYETEDFEVDLWAAMHLAPTPNTQPCVVSCVVSDTCTTSDWSHERWLYEKSQEAWHWRLVFAAAAMMTLSSVAVITFAWVA